MKHTTAAHHSVHKFIALAGLALTCLLISACASQPRDILVVADASGSAKGQGLLDQSRILSIVGQQLRDAPAGTQVFATQVTGDSMADTICPAVTAGLNYEVTDNTILDDASRGQALTDIQTELTEALTCASDRTTSGSDIFGAITEAASHKRAEAATLVVVADGKSNQPPVTTYPVPDDPQAAIERLRAAGLVPDLTGVNVIWFGLGARPTDDPSVTAALRDFWTHYLTAGGAASVEFER